MCSIIKITKYEYLSPDRAAICDCKVYLFNIPIYRNTVKTFNQEIVQTFLTSSRISIKGFNNETENLCKKN